MAESLKGRVVVPVIWTVKKVRCEVGASGTLEEIAGDEAESLLSFWRWPGPTAKLARVS